jgi:hypothetical protein
VELESLLLGDSTWLAGSNPMSELHEAPSHIRIVHFHGPKSGVGVNDEIATCSIKEYNNNDPSGCVLPVCNAWNML